MTKFEPFLQNLKTLGGHGASARSLFDQLASSWAGESRFYHNATHLAECLALAQEWGTTLSAHDKACLDLAIWFHDAVYIAGSTQSENRSADWAFHGLRGEGINREISTAVKNMVLSTNHSVAQPADAGELTDLLHDIDMAILGASPERFAEYNLAIEKEFAGITASAFKSGRKAVTAKFLEQAKSGVLYRTARGKLLTGNAIANLESLG